MLVLDGTGEDRRYDVSGSTIGFRTAQGTPELRTLIAQGEVVVVNEKFGIRLTDIITPSERIRKLNR